MMEGQMRVLIDFCFYIRFSSQNQQNFMLKILIFNLSKFHLQFFHSQKVLAVYDKFTFYLIPFFEKISLLIHNFDEE